MSAKQKILSWDVGIKNLAYCALDGQTIVSWKLLCLPACKPEDLCNVLCRVLNAEVFPEGLDSVVVERQPGRNKTMLRVEAYLAMYFAKQGLHVVTYHAGNKLKDTGQENKGRGAQMYRARKNASVDLARGFLKDTNQDGSVLERAKKKDDLADALMQGLSYLAGPTTSTKDKVVKPRKPTDRQKKLSKANILYLLKEKLKHTLFAFVPGTPLKVVESLVHSSDAKFQTSVARAFGSLEACANEIGGLVVPEPPFLGKVGTDDPVGMNAVP
jgi:hypothetical protein